MSWQGRSPCTQPGSGSQLSSDSEGFHVAYADDAGPVSDALPFVGIRAHEPRG